MAHRIELCPTAGEIRKLLGRSKSTDTRSVQRRT